MEGRYLDKLLLRKAAIQSVALMLGVIMLSYGVKQYNAVVISASYAQEKDDNNKPDLENIDNDLDIESVKGISDDTQNADKGNFIFTGVKENVNNDIIERLGEQYLIIRKPKGESLQIELEDIYITKQLKLVISGFTDDVPDNNYIARVYGEEVFLGKPNAVEIEKTEKKEDGTYTTSIVLDYGNDPVNGITVVNNTDNYGYSVHEINLQLNHVYVHILYEDENYYYIDLRRPKEVYEKVIVIDAGHGGKDPGALSKDEKTYEKTINLKILQELKALFETQNNNIKVYYTKTIDETLFLRPRVTLANDVDCDFFISIHCNANDYAGSNGTEILYYNHENKNIKTKHFAKIMSDELAKTVSLKNGGLVQMKDNQVFILANAKVPAVIVEAGYMTNQDDLKYLKSEVGQKNIAEGIFNGIWRAYEELMP